MTVNELIAHLRKQPKRVRDLQVGYNTCSEFCLLEATDIEIRKECVARADGWIARRRNDKPEQEYLMFPG